jgi:hypothetical protein
VSAPVLPPTAPRTPLWALGLFVAVFCALSVRFGADTSWDLRNYHLYDAHAALSGTLWRDIAPAQLQSFYDPALDVVRLLLLRALNAHPAILAMALALPHALAAWLALGIALRVGLPPGVALAAILLGATGAAGLSTLGTAMSEMVPGCLVLAGLGLVCRPPPPGPLPRGEGEKPALTRSAFLPSPCGRGWGRGLGTGLLTGAAIALKLTFAAYAPALAASLVASGRRRWLALWVAGAVAGALVIGGPWWWTVWRHTGNPLFPYFNEVFRSAWALPVAMTDARFLPADALHAAFFPVFWAIRPSQLVSELPIRDPRLALAWAGWLIVVVRAVRRREVPAAPVRALLAFWVVGFVAWEACFSILRYTATLELLAGIPIALALAPLRVRTIVVFAAVAAFTIYPDWGRAKPGPLAADVHPPAFPPNSLVLLLDPAPMAYVAAFSPPGVRFAGVNSNLLHPGGGTALARVAAEAVQRHDGPLWGLESPADQPGQADRALAAYGLVRGAHCERVRSNLDADAILACTLLRVQSSPRQAMISRPSAPKPRLMAMPASARSTRAANMRGISSRYPASRMR